MKINRDDRLIDGISLVGRMTGTMATANRVDRD